MGQGFVGILSVDVHFPMAASLKDKRSEVRRIKSGLARTFGCSVAEVDHHDQWQLAGISAAVVTAEAGAAEHLVDDALRWLERDPVGQVVREQRFVQGVSDGGE